MRIDCLPIACTNCSACATISSAVSRETTTSTSCMTGTGEKKCSPSTRSGCSVAAASRAIGIDDVLDASGMPGGTSRSSSRKMPALTCGSSYTASTTSWAPLTASRSVVEVIRASTRLGARSLELAGLRGTREALLDAPARAIEHGCVGLVLDDVEAAASRALGDPRPHEARADDCDRPGHDRLSLACDRRENSEAADRLTAPQADRYPRLPIVG